MCSLGLFVAFTRRPLIFPLFSSYLIIIIIIIIIIVIVIKILNLELGFMCSLFSPPRWCRGNISPRDPRFAGSNPADFFQEVKILSTSSSGRDFKPWVPSLRFKAR